MKIESVDLPTSIKVVTQEEKTPVTITKKPTPLQVSRRVKEVGKPIVIKSDEKTSLSSIPKDGKCYHNWFPWGKANEYIQYACEVSNYDIDFILTLNAENWSWDYKAQSRVIQKNWKREPSFWLCQMHYKYHKKDVYEWLEFKDIFKSKFLNDWKHQVEVCREKYKWGTTFYWYFQRYKVLKWLIRIGWKYY